MTASNDELELKDRLSLIETMIAEGRRTYESYGWTFVLWGVAYYIAIFWAYLSHGYLAWPVTMTATGVLTGVIIARKRSKNPATTTARALGALWSGTGISMFIVLFSLGSSGKMDLRIFVAVICGMLGSVNASSSMILKWKLQFACALAWWTTTIYACFGKGNYLMPVFLAALFLCQIVFGIYCMIREARVRRQEANHA
jgi:hypothetical protein